MWLYHTHVVFTLAPKVQTQLERREEMMRTPWNYARSVWTVNCVCAYACACVFLLYGICSFDCIIFGVSLYKSYNNIQTKSSRWLNYSTMPFKTWCELFANHVLLPSLRRWQWGSQQQRMRVCVPSEISLSPQLIDCKMFSASDWAVFITDSELRKWDKAELQLTFFFSSPHYQSERRMGNCTTHEEVCDYLQMPQFPTIQNPLLWLAYNVDMFLGLAKFSKCERLEIPSRHRGCHPPQVKCISTRMFCWLLVFEVPNSQWLSIRTKKASLLLLLFF